MRKILTLTIMKFKILRKNSSPPYVIDACYTSIKNKKISIKRDGEEVRILCDTPYGSCQITWDGDEWLLNDKGDLPDELVDLLNCTII